MDRAGRNGGTLRSFEKGQSGNPAGRPPRQDLISELIREYGQDDTIEIRLRSKDVNGVWKKQHLRTEVDGEERTIFAFIAVQLLMRACGGNFEAIKIILDRTEGRIPPPIKQTGLGTTNPLTVMFMDPEEKPSAEADSV